MPESHAASLALLVYASAWMTCHHPEIFCCALLNSQPMGFYAPAQIVRDAVRQGVTFKPVCVGQSHWYNVLEANSNGSLGVRLGFRRIKDLPEDDGGWIAESRGNGYHAIEAIWRRAGVGIPALKLRAGADAFATYGLARREAVWTIQGLGGDKPLPLFEQDGEGLPDIKTILPAMSLGEEVYEDYAAMRLSLRRHPVSLLRSGMPKFCRSDKLADMPDGRWVHVGGLIITRQRPETAKGVIFLTLEDDYATSNIAV